MTGFAATHTGSLTPSSDPWTFVGTVTWQSDIDPAILPDNEPVVLRLAFTTLSLTGATIAFTSSGSGRAATLPANGPFDGSTDYTVASHKNRTVTYTITGVGPVGSGALAMRARSENYDLLTADGTVAYTGGDLRCDIGGQSGAYGAGGGFAGAARGGIGGRVQTSITGVSAGSLTVDFEVGRGLQNGVPDGGGATVLYNGATLLAVAGGGGGGGLDGGPGSSYGGDGGGVVGEDGDPGVTNTGYWVPHGGKGGTQSAGGVGGFFQFAEGAGAAGTYLQGGDGGGGYAPAYGTDYYGGGGGGGYYGGGGGGGYDDHGPSHGYTSIWFGAGGGGSNYAHPTHCSSPVHTRGGATTTGDSMTSTPFALIAWGFVDLFAGDAIPSAAGWHIGSLRFGTT